MFILDERLHKDTALVGRFELCLLLLHRDSNYPWFILVPQREGISEIHHLSSSEQQLLLAESGLVARALTSLFAPDKLNIATLGNIVAQLHIHHVAPAGEYALDRLADRVEAMRQALAGEITIGDINNAPE